MPETSFLTPGEIAEAGFGSVGRDVRISRHATFYNPGRMSIGSHTRIDDFCVISCSDGGSVSFGDYVHVSTHCLVVAGVAVVFGDFSGISSGCRIFGSSDDYGGDYLTNPCVPEKYRKTGKGDVVLGRHAVVGAGTTILYGVTIGECSAIGAMSLVLHDVPAGQIHAGIPARYIRDRSRKVLEIERRLREEEGAR